MSDSPRIVRMVNLYEFSDGAWDAVEVSYNEEGEKQVTQLSRVEGSAHSALLAVMLKRKQRANA